MKITAEEKKFLLRRRKAVAYSKGIKKLASLVREDADIDIDAVEWERLRNHSKKNSPKYKKAVKQLEKGEARQDKITEEAIKIINGLPDEEKKLLKKSKGNTYYIKKILDKNFGFNLKQEIRNLPKQIGKYM